MKLTPGAEKFVGIGIAGLAVGVLTVCGAAQATAEAPHGGAAVTAPTSMSAASQSVDPMTLQGQETLVEQAHDLIPPSSRDNAELILTETRPSQMTPGAIDVEVGFADWSQSPLTEYDVVATVTPSSVSFGQMSSRKVKYTNNLDPFTISQFKISPTEAVAAAKAYDPDVDTAIVDMRKSNLPRQGLTYAIGGRKAVVIVSAITGQVVDR